MSTQETLMQVRVRAVTYEADGILGFELVPMPPLKELPAFTAGAHIDLHLPNGLLRSYSLLNAPSERHRYLIGVNKDAKSRGGSRYMHEVLRSGETLTIGAPRNNFPLDETSPMNVFIAGGIGITPMMSMIARSQALGTPWRLHYAARTRRNAAFLDVLQGFHNQPNAELRLNFDQEAGGQMLDLSAIVQSLPAGAHVYCCGPLPMLAAYEQATAGLPPDRVHMEYFAAKEAAATDGGFIVELARSGKQLEVRAGQTILDSLLAIGIEPPFSCQEGICGTCEVRVLEGTPDHRDLVLSNAEKAANDRMMICCSGCKTAKLVLDL
ncbi:PDR/VanB family oxidoreductase [Variovorax sp. YR216]|uniref:PDR/VanB family oxidoreductase n=1 Tax=Variovorax sp. YR216 TaxID=1882828 RepID=UPI00089AE6E5|nr:PDR/VanB family oxidoreductase [Variovorax sp. YR216]SEB24840.1 vanillate O-demethylase ferredoxin subunit [Variovorax sp. YR216]